MSKKEKLLSLLVVVYFFFSSLLHFARLTFSWEVSVGEYIVPTVVSGLCFVISVMMIMLAVKVLKEKKIIEKEDN